MKTLGMMAKTSILLSVVALAACVSTTDAAQGMPESYRDVQLRMLELQRSLLISMADSMPESLYRDKVTPVQRDFAQQIHHCAGAVGFVTARYFGAEMPALADTATGRLPSPTVDWPALETH